MGKTEETLLKIFVSIVVMSALIYGSLWVVETLWKDGYNAGYSDGIKASKSYQELKYPPIIRGI